MRKKQQLTIIISIVIAILILISCWLWLVPQSEQLLSVRNQKTAEREAYLKQIELLRSAETAISQAGSGGMPVALADLEKVIPSNQEMEDWYAMVENMAKDAQLTDPVAVTIGSPSGTGVAEVLVNVTATGSYDSIVRFIQAFQTALRPINIVSLDMIPKEAGGMAASIKAIAYVRAEGQTPITGDPAITSGAAAGEGNLSSGLQAAASLNPNFNANSQ